MVDSLQMDNSLEKDLKDLENLTVKLESGQMSLEDAIKAYEQGMSLALKCRKTLDEMTQKIEVLRKNSINASGLSKTENNDILGSN